MPIPQEILDVERPTNTVVIVYGKDKNHYAVRQRVGCKKVGDRRIPVNGPTIGHIVDGLYVSIDTLENPSIFKSSIDLKDWADIVFCDTKFKDIQDELLAVYNHHDMLTIYCIAILRVCSPGIKDYRLKEAYDTSFLSELYPGVALSKNTVSPFLKTLGFTCSMITKFMQNRTAAVDMDHHLLIDGTLKSDESIVNSLSDFSRKAKTKGTRDISVLYAYDLEAKEPICSKCFPGNMLDLTAYEAFISENGIKQGIIVADKGFPSSTAGVSFRDNPYLHYLNPIKRNSQLIEKYSMNVFTGILKNHEGITFRKEKCEGVDKWLYSYRDVFRVAMEEQGWLRGAKKKDTYTSEAHNKKQKVFGLVVLECDLDLPPETVYEAYIKRWEIEIVVRFYKSACKFDETREHSDHSVIGSEFCDFLSTLLTFRLLKDFENTKLMDTMTYKEIMLSLQRAKKAKLPGKDWEIIKISPYLEEILKKLCLLEEPVHIPRKRGRPRKSSV